MRSIVRATALSVVLMGGLLYAPAWAADQYIDNAKSGNEQPLPAVDGLNAKVSGFGGEADERGLYGAAGSVSAPLGFRYGVQIDGFIADYDSRFQGDVTAGGTALHLFWRDPSVGLIGAYGHYVHADAFGGLDIYAGGAEGALYWGRFTLEGVAGVDGGEVDGGPFGRSVDLDPRFFDVAQLAYYPVDNLKLSVGHSHILSENAALFGAEWGFDAGGGTMASLYAKGSVWEGGDGAVLGGLRVYFGGHDKTLIRRHREDDPSPAQVIAAIYQWFANRVPPRSP